MRTTLFRAARGNDDYGFTVPDCRPQLDPGELLHVNAVGQWCAERRRNRVDRDEHGDHHAEPQERHAPKQLASHDCTATIASSLPHSRWATPGRSSSQPTARQIAHVAKIARYPSIG